MELGVPDWARVPAEPAAATPPLPREVVEGLVFPFVMLRAVRDVDGTIVDFVYTEANRAACEYNGLTHEQLVGARLLDLLPGHIGSGLFAQYVAVVESGEPLVLDDVAYEQELLGGQPRRYDVRAARVGDGLAYSWQDVTPRYVMQRALAESEEHYRLLAEHITDVVFRDDADLRFRWVSPSVRALGWEPADLVGRVVEDFVHPEDAATIRARRAAIGPADPLRLQVRFRVAGGGYRWMSWAGRGFRDAAGRPAGRVIVLRDIDEQVAAQAALAEREAYYRVLAENASDVVFRGDNDGVIEWMSPLVTGLLGWEPAELVGRPFVELMHPDDVPALRAAQRRVSGGTPAQYETRVRTRDGDWREVSVHARPLRDHTGAIIGRVGSWRAIG